MRHLITDIVESRREFLVVGTARDGAEAIQKIRSLRPDIVTLDFEMPGMDGLTTLSKIMSEMPRPVVMLSAAGSDSGTQTQFARSNSERWISSESRRGW